MEKSKTFIQISFFVLACLFLSTAIANENNTQERQGQLMSVYLLHFANYIQWPKKVFSDDEMFTLCTFADDRLASFVSELADEQVLGRRIQILYQPPLDKLASCQIVFFQHDFIQQFIEYKSSIDNLPILSVSDAEDFNETGGVIEYYLQDNKLRFAINLNLAQRYGLTISSKLLRLAKIVNQRGN